MLISVMNPKNKKKRYETTGIMKNERNTPNVRNSQLSKEILNTFEKKRATLQPERKKMAKPRNIFGTENNTS